MSARTGVPPAASSRTSSEPTWPVAPVTKIVDGVGMAHSPTQTGMPPSRVRFGRMTPTDTSSLVTGVDFVAQLVTDFDRAVAFYGDTLGLRRSVHVPERGFAEFETVNLTL